MAMLSPSKQTSNQLNAYAIFLILERQRNIKLRELYHNKLQVADTLLPMISEESPSSDAASTSTHTPTRKTSLRKATKQTKKIKKCDALSSIGSSSSSMSTLPKFPPRYQALSNIITSDVLMMHLRTTTNTTTMSTSPRSCSIRPRSSSSRYMDEYKNLDQGTKRFLNDTVKLLQDRCKEEIENNVKVTKLEIPMGRSSTKRSRRRVVGSKMLVFRVEKKLSLIVD